MLDFAELASDGVRFEQLVRELLLRSGLRPNWTGKGPDSGRDLIAEELVRGPLTSSFSRWLVDCKHFAGSKRSVGVGDVTDIVDRCERASASGFLFATSTQPSSELMRKFDELSQKKQLSIVVWDAVDLEKRLLTHTNYALAQQFFSSSGLERWRIFYTEREQRWTAHYNGNFLYVESRSGIDPPSLAFLEKIIAEILSVPVAPQENVRVRAIWHDTPNGCFYNCWADYLVPSDKVPSMDKYQFSSFLKENIEGQIINWEIDLRLTLPHSDYYDLDDDRYYERFKEPLYYSIYRVTPSRASKDDPDWWKVSPPVIRGFSDALMWDKVKSLHGFADGVVMSPPYRK